ncbi:Cellobiose dehydrogenase [Daldinia childiae]|uniref:Cellobiose dehydrogenase n=1 Tax=Daldinia childiae TaxID=326645 RepID=UPI00144571C1|nr:Cellobiose dehydrogenase [Daldinia childiae]XP_033437654.1 Cellobiose dehydrogenase [Daldinia childiae]KAF3058966.1 Cellobiose dehydrogenase [Daldinia childiae]KAF3062779.1 Cellobiose dehydrogenase [Daldinia childiae]
MGRFGLFASLLLAVSLNVQKCLGQASAPTLYKDSKTGIAFDTWTVPDKADGSGGVSAWGGLTFGVALPENALTVDATEFIGYLKCGSNGTTTNGWCGLSFGGPMTNSLLLMAWPYEDEILTSLRFVSGYTSPDVYTGNAKLTQISSTIDKDHYTLIFRCQNCLVWDQDGASGSASTSAGSLILGWASSLKSPGNPACPADITINFHSNGQSIWGATLDENAANPSYSEWAAQATATVTGSCGGATPTTTTSTTTSIPTATGIPVPTGTYDYIVVGAGAGGIPLADKLSEAGKSVLLIEKGPPSSGRWGGSLKPEWLDGTNLTRFDVPGLCNEIWVNSAGIACTDTDQMAGCVLGGGTAVNAGLWWKTDTVITHPNVVFYDFYEAWDNPNVADKSLYLDSRSGILAQAAPNIGPMFWDEIKGDDGVVRQLQWTARVEGSAGTPNGYAMTMSQYLGRGAKSRGRMTITKALTTVVSTLPYLQDKNDVQAVIQGIKNLQAALANVEGLTWTYPPSNTTVEDFVNDMLVSYTNRRSNHWIGTSKLGTDDGRTNSGSAVVDLNTRVYGTDNLFVVDASIFPGHITTNPTSYIVIVAEHASEKILALASPKAQSKFAQCGGLQWTGSFQCAAPYTCQYQNEYYSQCV